MHGPSGPVAAQTPGQFGVGSDPVIAQRMAAVLPAVTGLTPQNQGQALHQMKADEQPQIGQVGATARRQDAFQGGQDHLGRPGPEFVAGQPCEILDSLTAAAMFPVEPGDAPIGRDRGIARPRIPFHETPGGHRQGRIQRREIQGRGIDSQHFGCPDHRAHQPRHPFGPVTQRRNDGGKIGPLRGLADRDQAFQRARHQRAVAPGGRDRKFARQATRAQIGLKEHLLGSAQKGGHGRALSGKPPQDLHFQAHPSRPGTLGGNDRARREMHAQAFAGSAARGGHPLDRLVKDAGADPGDVFGCQFLARITHAGPCRRSALLFSARQDHGRLTSAGWYRFR